MRSWSISSASSTRAATAYDTGVESEAKRLATTIRVLVHDGRRPSRSLLTHLGVRDRLPWTDTGLGVLREAALTIGSGLCITQMDPATGESRFAALLGNLPPERIHPGAAFADWWRDSVLTDADGTEFSRKDLVLQVANKDGGAHVDATLPTDYAALTRDNSIGVTQGPVTEPNSAVLGFGLTVSADGLARARAEGDPRELARSRARSPDRLGTHRHDPASPCPGCPDAVRAGAHLRAEHPRRGAGRPRWPLPVRQWPQVRQLFRPAAAATLLLDPGPRARRSSWAERGHGAAPGGRSRTPPRGWPR